MQVVQVSSEIVPWSKVGGLGDVSGALPAALAARGHRVMTVAPRYQVHPDQRDTGWRSRVWLCGGEHEVAWFVAEHDGVQHFFLDNPSYRRDGVYGDAYGAFGDNLFRYALLCRAALTLADLPLEGGPLADDVVWHCNDWHSGLVPVYLDAVYRPAGRMRGACSILAIHNAAHHGRHGGDQFIELDLAARWWPTCDFDGQVNLLKAGIEAADQIVTVSPTYAREITRHGAGGLEGLLRGRLDDLHGIVNGVGPEWDPATDVRLPERFSLQDRTGKAVCKAALQRHFGLEQRPDVPILAFIGRLVPQKGLDLIQAVMERLSNQDVQLVMLGSGMAPLEDWMRSLPARRPGWWGSFVGYSEDLAHLVEAGADVFLMPSRFEPCGLNQLYSMRYGTLPVVHAVGGLVDTVEPVDVAAGRGTGFRFYEPTVAAFEGAVRAALDLYAHPADWRAAQDRAMAQSWSWAEAASAYERVYERAKIARDRAPNR